MAGDSVTIRVPRWLVMAVVAVVLIGGGLGAGLLLGGGDDAKVSAGKRSSAASTTTSTAPFLGVGPADENGDGGRGNDGEGNNGGGGAPVAPAEPGAPAAPEVPPATAEVSKTGAGVCPTVVTWEGHGGTKGYTLQVYHAVNPGTVLYNGPVAGVGSHSFDCAGDIPVVGLVRLNTNTDTGTVSDTA